MRTHSSQPFGLPRDGRIALRVGNDKRHLRQLKLVKSLSHIGRNAEVGELHQKIVLAIDGVLGGIFECVFNVFVGKVKIAAKAEGDASVEPFAKRSHALLVDLRLKGVHIVGVGSADNMRGAVGNRRLGHRNRGLNVGRSIVKTKEQVVMNIDHGTLPSQKNLSSCQHRHHRLKNRQAV